MVQPHSPMEFQCYHGNFGAPFRGGFLAYLPMP